MKTALACLVTINIAVGKGGADNSPDQRTRIWSDHKKWSHVLDGSEAWTNYRKLMQAQPSNNRRKITGK